MNKYIYKWIDHILVFIFSFIIFSFLIKHVSTDIQLHVRQLARINVGESSYTPNFLFYFLVNLFSGFSNNMTIMLNVAAILLSMATTGKYMLSKNIIIDLLASKKQYSNRSITLISIALLLCFAIPDYYAVFTLNRMYLGRIVPIVWHNSTTIFLFPFAILLFWQQLRILYYKSSPSYKESLILIFLVIINILIKPSFIFVFIPITFFLILKKNGLFNYKKLFIDLLPLFIGFALIVIQYFILYYFQIGSFQKQTSSVTIETPFKVIGNWIPFWYIPIAFLLSLALPLSSIICYKEILKYKPFMYSLYLTIFGILIGAFIVETGPRMYHGNFIWQNVICAYLLFLSNVTFLIPKFLNKEKKSKKVIYLGIIFMLHFISGILYLAKIYITRQYV